MVGIRELSLDIPGLVTKNNGFLVKEILNMTGERIFVFGSNLSGIHGAGAALFALRNYGAVYGIGAGPTGNAYAIPTMVKCSVLQKFIGTFLFILSY